MNGLAKVVCVAPVTLTLAIPISSVATTVNVTVLVLFGASVDKLTELSSTVNDEMFGGTSSSLVTDTSTSALPAGSPWLSETLRVNVSVELPNPKSAKLYIFSNV